MICIPVAVSTHAEALQIIKRSVNMADILELRMDMIGNGKIGELIDAIRDLSENTKVLVTNRAIHSADNKEREEERIAVLRDAVEKGVDFIDLELTVKPFWKEKLNSLIAKCNHRTKLIISHHEFYGTPSLGILRKYFREGVESGAHIVKIVTLARSPEDNMRILSLIPYARRRHVDIIAFCMGEQGKISRIMAPLLGSYLTFASLEQGSESAVGQLTVQEMKIIFSLLNFHG